MLSRVADALYWTSRYVERAENVARFVNVNLDLMLDSPTAERPSWEPLVQTTGDNDWFHEHYTDYSPQSVTRFLTFDAQYPNSIVASVRAARENARTVREVISREMWEAINALYLHVRGVHADGQQPEEMAPFYDGVKRAGIHFAGATDATLSQGEAWHFSRLGRMLERADKTSRILDVKYYILLPEFGSGEFLRAKGEGSEEKRPSAVTTAIDQVGWTALLNSASALQMYRQKHHIIAPREVAQFLLLDEDFPRSIRHCVRSMHTSLHEITNNPVGSYKTEAERLLGLLASQLDYARIDEIMDFGLHEYLDDLQERLNAIGNEISKRFFDTVV